MRKAAWSAAALLCAGVWAADLTVSRALPAGGAAARSCDATLELKWDNGSPMWLVVWSSGRGVWVGNDYDIATISGYRGVESIRMFSAPRWPNARWDGFRLGIFAFDGGVPGSLLWGPKFVVGTGTGDKWYDFRVGWTLPAANDKFVSAIEQYYDFPNADPHTVDNDRTFLGHSWLYAAAGWRPYTNIHGYYNLMIRVVVYDETSAVAPTSLGRVKALYY